MTSWEDWFLFYTPATTPSKATDTARNTTRASVARWLDVLCAGLAAGVIARLWVQPLRSSLWLDELGTWWVTNSGLAGVVARARLFPQSIPYADIVCAARAAAGSSEIALRLPSLAAALLLVWVVYRLGAELFDRDTGLLAAGLLVAFPPIVTASHDARPYAFAVLAATCAAWMLARWMRRGRAGDAAGYVIAAAAMVYFQYLFAVILVAHAAWVWTMLRGEREKRFRAGQGLAAAGALAILLVPAAVLVREIGRDAALHSFRGAPRIIDVVNVLLPASAAAVAVLCVLVVWAARWIRLRRGDGDGTEATSGPLASDANALRLLILWTVLPVALLAAVAWATGIGVFDARYLMGVVPAQALLLAWVLRRFEPAAGRRAVLALYLLLVLVGRWSAPEVVREDWRSAAAAVRAANRGSGRPVLLGGTFVESRSIARVEDPVHASYLRAPLDYYDAGGTARVLPLREGKEAEAYVARLLEDPSLANGFALVERTSSRHSSWSAWVEARARERGLVMRRVWDGERLKGWVFETGK